VTQVWYEVKGDLLAPDPLRSFDPALRELGTGKGSQKSYINKDTDFASQVPKLGHLLRLAPIVVAGSAVPIKP